MSKLSISRLLEEIEARQASSKRGEQAKQKADSLSGKKALTNQDKQEIQNIIVSTTAKVAELIDLLQGCNKSEQGGHDYYYQPRWGYSQLQLKKIRPLKNEVASGYFTIGETLRIHNILEGDTMQSYYAQIKGFKQNYHATTLTSIELRNFHESIQKILGPLVNKAFKAK